MTEYTFQRITGEYITVTASSEDNARQKAMIKLWGVVPDMIVTYAPKYEGKGLSLSKEGI